MAQPILVMQMQRMGDLILSFPLFLWLQRQFPGREIWVLAERSFYEPLMPISPEVTYFPWEGTHVLQQQNFELILNLSIQSRAAQLAGQLTAQETFGAVATADGTYIHGDWQLYRASLVKNNRFNRFHWADLNALDVIPLARMAKTTYSPPTRPVSSKPQVGLFLGASDPAKQPGSGFWANLCFQLAQRSIQPALFGGPAEAELGQEVVRLVGKRVSNFCGSFGLDQLSRAMHGLNLFVTPDTGPMHLAAWNACPTLNLSMGNVSPWETGPYTPGHSVLRADLPCAPGCWECTRSKLYCHVPIDGPGDCSGPDGADPVAAFIARSVKGHVPTKPPPGMTLARTARDRHGLYDLQFAGTGDPLRTPSLFWQQLFGWQFGLWDEEHARQAAQDFTVAEPVLARQLASEIPLLLKRVATGLTTRSLPRLWDHSPEITRPFTGWADLVLENGNGSRNSFNKVITFGQAGLDLLIATLH